MINYYLITKPGIIMGNLITLVAGFALAANGSLNFALFFATLLGLAFIMASACVFNNYIDRELDKKMARTKERALVKGAISTRNALLFATVLGLIGNLVLYVFTNVLTLFIANIGFFVYVVLYSMWKSKTIYGTAIGSIAGAVPPVVGYCAVSNHFDAGALILFTMLVFWQMPHFFSIAMLHFDDYRAASIPVLPVIKGWHVTKKRMLLYIGAFIAASLALIIYGKMGMVYLVAASLLGAAWFLLCLKGFKSKNEKTWAKSMFRFSLVVVTALSLMVTFN